MEIVVSLDKESGVPLYRQLVEALEKLIKSGQLPPGSKLPSNRELAETLKISHFTASSAYDELRRLGFIATKPMSGTFVCQVSGVTSVTSHHFRIQTTNKLNNTPTDNRLSNYADRIISSPDIEPADIELCSELNYFAPAPEQLPLGKWQEVLVKHIRQREPRSYVHDVLGHEGLRMAVADFLRRTRSMRCSYEQVAIFSGTEAALDLVSRILIDPDDVTIVENPGFPGARRTFAAYGAQVVPVPIDDHGIVVQQLYLQSGRPKVLYLTPSHQDPSGVILSATRRRQVLNWAQQKDVWIIEDDFDSEYRYGDKPTPALQSNDTHQRVIYINTFRKLMFPVLCLGFIVVPPRLLRVLRQVKSLVSREFQFIEHEAFAGFISEGHLEKQLRRMRRVYTKRREMLIAGLNQHLGTSIRISPMNTGTHLCIQFDASLSEQKILDTASRAALPLVSTRASYVGNPRTNEMLLPFAHVDEHHIGSCVERFAQLLLG